MPKLLKFLRKIPECDMCIGDYFLVSIHNAHLLHKFEKRNNNKFI